MERFAPQYKIDVPLRCSKYESSRYSYVDGKPFWETFNPTGNCVYVPKTKEDFMDFIQREYAVCLVFLGNSKDPTFQPILDKIKPFANSVNKLIIVDVGLIPSLGMKYDIKCPTLIKCFQGHLLRVYENAFTEYLIKKFAFATSTWRFASVR